MTRTTTFQIALLALVAGSARPSASEAQEVKRDLSPADVAIPGHRRAIALVSLAGKRPEQLDVRYLYAAHGVDLGRALPDLLADARVGVARASCSSFDADTALCGAILPTRVHARPNVSDARAIQLAAGSEATQRFVIADGGGRPGSSSAPRRFRLARPFTLANFGDSYASGEGAPSKTRPAWEDKACHRSVDGGRRRAMDRAVTGHPELDFRVNDFACSGATIEEGILGPQRNQASRSQVQQLRDWITGQHLEALDVALLSIGGNDLGFADVVKACLVPGGCATAERRRTLVRLLAILPDRYRLVDDDLSGLTQHVLLSETPDLTRNEDGDFCTSLQMLATDATMTGITKDDMMFAFDEFVVPFNRVINRVAADHGWGVIGGLVEATRRHGICVGRELGPSRCTERWFMTPTCSLVTQGDAQGAFHMSRTGQEKVLAQQSFIALDVLLHQLLGQAYARALAEREPAVLARPLGLDLEALKRPLPEARARTPLTAAERARIEATTRQVLGEVAAAWKTGPK